MLIEYLKLSGSVCFFIGGLYQYGRDGFHRREGIRHSLPVIRAVTPTRWYLTGSVCFIIASLLILHTV